MSSFIDRLHEQTVSPALLWLHGDDEGNCMRCVGGDPAHLQEVRGIFYPANTVRDEARGVEFVTQDILEVAATQTVAENDKFLIDGDVFKVLAVGRAVGGIKAVTLKRIEQKVRKGPRDII